MTESLAVVQAAVDAASGGRAAVLATIIRARGSTPRGTGSRMLIEPGRGIVGTIGGGCGEAEVIECAIEVVRTGVPRIVRIDLTEDLLSWSPAVCGGILEVFVEPVADEATGRSLPSDGSE
jgi:xanthine/CO dehydrogenase XdhC/CoxF family maturation factor